MIKNLEEEEAERVGDYVKMTAEQKKALIQLKKVFTQCRKLGIEFWDDYGSFTAYNAKKMGVPVPDDDLDYQYQGCYAPEICSGCEVISEAGNTCGNADDPLFFNIKGKIKGK